MVLIQTLNQRFNYTSVSSKLSKESSLDGYESMEVYKQGTTKEIYTKMTCIEEYEEGERKQNQISAREVDESDDEYVLSGEKRFGKSFNQKEFSNFIRDTGVLKDIGFTSSVLIRRGLARQGTKSLIYKEQEKELRKYFTLDENKKLVYCADVGGLLNE